MTFARPVRTALLAAAAGTLLASCSRPVSAAWPMYQLRPDHNAVLPRPALRSRWRVKLGAKVNGGLAFAGGTLYVDTFGREVLAVDARSGAILWRHPLANVAMSTPIVAGDDVIVGSGRNGPMKDATSEYRLGQVVHEWGVARGDTVVALSAADGHEAWSFATAGEDMPSGAAADGKLVFGNGDLHAYALDLRSGRQAWKADLPGIVTMASSNVAGANAIVSACTLHYYVCTTLALDVANGSVAWTAPYGDQDSAPTLGGSNVYLSGFTWRDCTYPAASSTVFAVDAATGALRWQYRMRACGDFTTDVSHERAIAGVFDAGTYYQAGATENAMYAFDAATGAVRFRFATAARVKMSGVVYRGALIFADTRGNLYAIDAKTGAPRAHAGFDERFTTSPPVVIGSTLFIATERSLLALSPRTLSLR